MKSEKENMIAIVNCRLIDGTGRPPLENACIIIRDKVIWDVGRQGEVQVPDNAQVIDARGRTVMPGLIDAHVHVLGLKTADLVKEPLVTPLGVFFARAVRSLERLVSAGYTTIRDTGGIISLHLKSAVEEGSITGPRIVAAGYTISQTFGHGDVHYLPVEWVDARASKKLTPLAHLLCDGVEDCRKTARYALREGADFLKIFTTGGVMSQRDKPEYTQFTTEEIRAIVEEAEHVGTFVASHAQGAQGIKNAIKAGVKTIEHAIFIDEEGIQLAVERGAIIVPTLSIVERILERGEKAGVPEWGLKKAEEVYSIHVENIKKAVKAGVKIAAGTDFFNDALGEMGENALELQLLVEKLGLSPMEAIIAATKNAAEACGLQEKIGTIEKGKLADLLIVDGNPLADISVLREPDNIKLVVKEGCILKKTF